jgi:hypothetical protein
MEAIMKLYRVLFRCLLPAALVFSACACSTEAAIQKILGDSTEAPVFLDCKPVSETEIVFSFSRAVKVVSLLFDPAAEFESIGEGAPPFGQEVLVSLKSPLKAGEKITADILVEDESRNTLNVLIPFRTRNDRIPALLINEIRTEYSKPKVEFVELKAQSDGNLAALRLFIAGNSLSKPVYEFPPAEVKAGDYIVLHLRTVETGCTDETGDDLALSGGTEALATARDFWVNGTSKLLKKTDAVYLMDQDNAIIDGILMSENPDPWWIKAEFASAAELLSGAGTWLPPSGDFAESSGIASPSEAMITTGTTATRSICRDEAVEDSNTANDWYIAATSNATPGKANSTKRYQQ